MPYALDDFLNVLYGDGNLRTFILLSINVVNR